jgi:crossover junction endodeoxyribonuclease RuvC
MLVNVLKGVNPKTILEEKLDATDAVAVALCHYYQNKTASADKKFSGWDSFIKSNPERKI